MQIISRSIADIIPYEQNAKKHPADQVQLIANSIKKFGFKIPCVIDKDNNLIAGHGRLLAAKKLKLKEVPCVIADDLTDDEIKAFRLADNKVAESDWDLDILNSELNSIELDMTLFGFEPEEEKQEVVEVPVPDEIKVQANPGDVWILGRHRLMCGDSTDREAVERLMNGEKADMVFTDPPYNVAIGSRNAFLNSFQKAGRCCEDIANDKGMTDEEVGEKLWKPAFSNMREFAKDDCSIYVTMPQGGTHMMMMMMMMMNAAWQVKHELIWVKNNHVLGRTDYFYKHEPICFGWAKTHKFYGKGKFNKSVWEIPKPQKSDLHPTMKPIELIANALLNSSKESDNILDLFGGSGSTLIACEQTDRNCYMMELDPKFASVIIQRYIDFKGSDADVFCLRGGYCVAPDIDI